MGRYIAMMFLLAFVTVLASSSGEGSDFSALEAQVVNELMQSKNLRQTEDMSEKMAHVVMEKADSMQPAESSSEAAKKGFKSAVSSNRAEADDKDEGRHVVSSSEFGSLGPLETQIASSVTAGGASAAGAALSDSGNEHDKSVFDSGKSSKKMEAASPSTDGSDESSKGEEMQPVSVARAAVSSTATSGGDAVSSGHGLATDAKPASAPTDGAATKADDDDDQTDSDGFHQESAIKDNKPGGGQHATKNVESLASAPGKTAMIADEDGNIIHEGDYSSGGSADGSQHFFSVKTKGDPKQITTAHVPDEFKKKDPFKPSDVFNSRLTTHLGVAGPAQFPATEAEARYAAMTGLSGVAPVEDDPSVVQAKIELMQNLAGAQSRLHDAILAQIQAKTISQEEGAALMGSVSDVSASAVNGTSDDIVAADLAAARMAMELSSGDAEKLAQMGAVQFKAVFEDMRQQALDQLEDSEQYEEAVADNGEVDCRKILQDTYNKIPSGHMEVDLKEAKASMVPEDEECTEIRSCVMETHECSADARSCMVKRTMGQSQCDEIQKCVRYLGCKVSIIQDHIVALINKSLREKAHAITLKKDAAAEKVDNNMLREQIARAQVKGEMQRATEQSTLADEKEQEAKLAEIKAEWAEENEKKVIAKLTGQYKDFEDGLRKATQSDLEANHAEIVAEEDAAKNKMTQLKDDDASKKREHERLQKKIDDLERQKALSKKKAAEEAARLKKMQKEAEDEAAKAHAATERLKREKENLRIKALNEKQKAQEKIKEAEERRKHAEERIDDLKEKHEQEKQDLKDQMAEMRKAYNERIDKARAKFESAKEKEIVSRVKIATAKQKQANMIQMNLMKNETQAQIAEEQAKTKKLLAESKKVFDEEARKMKKSNEKLKLALKNSHKKGGDEHGGSIPPQLHNYLNSMVQRADAAVKVATAGVAKSGGSDKVPEDMDDLKQIRQSTLDDEADTEEEKLKQMKDSGASEEEIKKEADEFADNLALNGEKESSAEIDAEVANDVKEALGSEEGGEDGDEEPPSEDHCHKKKHRKHPKCKKHKH